GESQKNSKEISIHFVSFRCWAYTSSNPPTTRNTNTADAELNSILRSGV
ncbi:hypothetical protein X975_05119, partial [Stegodyphus mimosarum]